MPALAALMGDGMQPAWPWASLRGQLLHHAAAAQLAAPARCFVLVCTIC
jgi:hypothetical protein